MERVNSKARNARSMGTRFVCLWNVEMHHERYKILHSTTSRAAHFSLFLRLIQFVPCPWRMPYCVLHLAKDYRMKLNRLAVHRQRIQTVPLYVITFMVIEWEYYCLLFFSQTYSVPISHRIAPCNILHTVFRFFFCLVKLHGKHTDDAVAETRRRRSKTKNDRVAYHWGVVIPLGERESVHMNIHARVENAKLYAERSHMFLVSLAPANTDHIHHGAHWVSHHEFCIFIFVPNFIVLRDKVIQCCE